MGVLSLRINFVKQEMLPRYSAPRHMPALEYVAGTTFAMPRGGATLQYPGTKGWHVKWRSEGLTNCVEVIESGQTNE